MADRVTPLPWAAVDAENNGIWWIESPSGHSADVATVWGMNDDGEANAEFIVRAVNSHYQLVEALEGLLARWDVFTGPERNGWGNMEEAYYDLAKHATAEWKAARAALTTAKGD